MTARFTRNDATRTDPELLALLEQARNHVMTPEEFEEQRISFVIGQMGMTHPEWTREETEARVRDALRLPPAGTPTRAELEAEVARLREWCSAAADDLAGLLAAMKAGVGSRFDDLFRRLAEELAETSAFMRAAAEGRADGTIYEAELTKAKNERAAARAAVVQMREDCAKVPDKLLTEEGFNHVTGSAAVVQQGRIEAFAAVAAAIRALPTADCRLPTAES